MRKILIFFVALLTRGSAMPIIAQRTAPAREQRTMNTDPTATLDTSRKAVPLRNAKGKRSIMDLPPL